MDNKVIKIIFGIYIFSLPFHSSPYFTESLGSWFLNYSLIPLLALLLYLFVNSNLTQNRIFAVPIGQKNVIQYFFYFNFYSLFITIIGSFLILNSSLIFDSSTRSPEMNSFREIIRVFFTISSFIVILLFFRTQSNLKIFFASFFVSLLIFIFYGYLQIYLLVSCGLGGYLCDGDMTKTFFESFSPYIDQGWQNEGRMDPYIFYVGRINLFTPEASTAAAIMLIYFLPILMGSVLSGYRIFRKNLFGFKYESIFLFLSIPLILFTLSTAGMFVLGILTFFFILLSALKKDKKIFFVSSLLILVFSSIAIYFFYVFELFSLLSYFLFKIFDFSVGSTNTRLALFIGSFDLFLNYPLGVGFGNNQTLLTQFVPFWSFGNYEIINGIINENLPTLNLWLNILTSQGIIGFLLFIAFIKVIWDKNVNFREFDNGNLNEFKLISFLFFLISFSLLSFSQSNMVFIWFWSLLGFYAGLSNFSK